MSGFFAVGWDDRGLTNSVVGSTSVAIVYPPFRIRSSGYQLRRSQIAVLIFSFELQRFEESLEPRMFSFGELAVSIEFDEPHLIAILDDHAQDGAFAIR